MTFAKADKSDYICTYKINGQFGCPFFLFSLTINPHPVGATIGRPKTDCYCRAFDV